MTNRKKLQLDATKVPAFPFAPVQYEQRHQDQFHRILTQYLNQIDNINSSLLLDTGGAYLASPNGSFISTSPQTAAVINTAYAVTLSAVDGTPGNNVFIGSKTANTFPSSRIYAPSLGIYNMQFSLQLENTDSADHDVNIWLRYNGSNVADSNTLVSVPSKHGTNIPGHAVAAWNFFLPYADANDYYELFWSASNTAVSIPTYAAAAPAPATPSVILTMQFVSRL